MSTGPTAGDPRDSETHASGAIAAHFAAFPSAQRAALERTWTAIRSALPGGLPAIAYGMPTIKLDQVSVVGLDGFRRHNSLFPYSGTVTQTLADRLSRYEQTKGSIHFPVDSAFPTSILRLVLRTRIAEINAGYPKKSGEVREFYDNGFCKVTGSVRNDQPHGMWQWYRRDGTLLRTGQFRSGIRAGTWTTYDRAGAAVTTTRAEG